MWGTDCVLVSGAVGVRVPEIEGVDGRDSVGVAIIDRVGVMGAEGVGDAVEDGVSPVTVAYWDRVAVLGVLADMEWEGVVDVDLDADLGEVAVSVGVVEGVATMEAVCERTDDLVGNEDWVLDVLCVNDTVEDAAASHASHSSSVDISTVRIALVLLPPLLLLGMWKYV